MTRPARPEVLAFLADVKDNPDDLAPWLVLTDWLEENGDDADRARAEYCRLCLDRLQPRVTAADWPRGERRRELYRQHATQWLGPTIKGLVHKMEGGLATINASAYQLVELVSEMAADPERWAWVGGLSGGYPVVQLVEQVLAPFLAQLGRLSVPAVLDGSDVVLLANCPALHRLVYLHLTVHRFEEAAMVALAQSPFLGRLRHVRVTYYYTHEGRDAAARILEQRFARVDVV
jgi:uncharacterized protein (TIGR02996 family)